MTLELLTLEQTAKVLRVKYARAAELARDGVIPVVRLGRQIRVDPERLSNFISRGGKALPGGWRKEAGIARQ
jgi:excisionase family DNA binding protein